MGTAKKVNTALALLAAMGIVAVAAACSPSLEAPPAPPVQATTPWEPLSTPEPEPVPDEGSLANPWPAGHEATVSDASGDLYSVSAKLVSGDATAAIMKANQFNDVPPDGSKYIIVEYTFTGLSASEPVDPGYESYAEFAVATPDGRVFAPASAVLPGTDLDDSPDLYEGQSFAGIEAYIVPSDADTFLVTAIGKYFALQ